jgi:hypothetical protein
LVSPVKTPKTDQTISQARIIFPTLSQVKTRKTINSTPSSQSQRQPSSSVQAEKEEIVIDTISKRMLMIHYIVKNKQSIRSAFSLQNLIDSAAGPSLTSLLLHNSPFSTKGFIFALKKAIKEDLQLKLKKYRYYSIMIDDSKDNGGIIEMSVYIRFIGRNLETTSSFISFCELGKDGSGSEVLFQHLIKVLKDWNLNPLDMIALTTDGASNMVGILSGVYARLKQHFKIERLISIHCVAHRTHLLAEALFQQYHISSTFSNTLLVISHVASIFHHSPTKKAHLNDIVKKFGFKTISIPIEGETRWLSRFERFYCDLVTLSTI